jgi:hypothetical protein
VKATYNSTPKNNRKQLLEKEIQQKKIIGEKNSSPSTNNYFKYENQTEESKIAISKRKHNPTSEMRMFFSLLLSS